MYTFVSEVKGKRFRVSSYLHFSTLYRPTNSRVCREFLRFAPFFLFLRPAGRGHLCAHLRLLRLFARARENKRRVILGKIKCTTSFSCHPVQSALTNINSVSVRVWRANNFAEKAFWRRRRLVRKTGYLRDCYYDLRECPLKVNVDKISKESPLSILNGMQSHFILAAHPAFEKKAKHPKIMREKKRGSQSGKLAFANKRARALFRSLRAMQRGRLSLRHNTRFGTSSISSLTATRFFCSSRKPKNGAPNCLDRGTSLLHSRVQINSHAKCLLGAQFEYGDHIVILHVFDLDHLAFIDVAQCILSYMRMRLPVAP